MWDEKTQARVEARLTPRLREVMPLLASGMTDKQIATAIGAAPGTVQKHIAEMLDRLGVPNRTAAVALWLGWPTLAPRDSEFGEAESNFATVSDSNNR